MNDEGDCLASRVSPFHFFDPQNAVAFCPLLVSMNGTNKFVLVLLRRTVLHLEFIMGIHTSMAQTVDANAFCRICPNNYRGGARGR